MKWESPNADEHVLCDAKGSPTEYRVRRDPVTGLYIARDGELRLMMRLALRPCQEACEEKYQRERASNTTQRNKRGRNSKRNAA